VLLLVVVVVVVVVVVAAVVVAAAVVVVVFCVMLTVHVPIIRRNKCIYATLGICHSET
jgi:hypothetical protein